MHDEAFVIIGGGLAGTEAAWRIANRGKKVILHEMKPTRFSEAHHSPLLGELVCSNSLKSEALDTAQGLLKEEMSRLNSLIIKAARENRVPAGSALAVDRDRFSQYITTALEATEQVQICREEITTIPETGTVIIATGPLTPEPFVSAIMELTSSRNLYFYDAISPIVTAESINFAVAFRASRYGKGGDDYVNCPLNREEYYQLVEAIKKGEKVQLRNFEETMPFEGCLPTEDLVERGDDTLAFGPMKPVGLIDPRTGKQPFAVAQLRQENKEATLYNMVGFQTKLKYGEQERIFRMIPGLEHADFVRHGTLHRNTFINAPRLLKASLQLQTNPRIFFAGQITGVEGYVESAAMGLLAAINAVRDGNGQKILPPPRTTALGALIGHVTNTYTKEYQPMSINFGLFPPLGSACRKRDKRRLLSERALRNLEIWKESIA